MFLINLHTILYNDKAKTYIFFLLMYYIIYISIQTFAMRLEIELRCILFPLIILEMFVQLELSPHVVNAFDWT